MAGLNPHDVFFKSIFGSPQVAADAIRRVLPPACVEAIDWDRLEPVPTEFVDGTLGDRRADLIFRAPLAGREAFLFLLYEHQSSVDPLMPFRALVYAVRIWERWLRDNPGARRLPPVVPVVLYHGARPWSGPVAFGEVLDLPAPLARALGPHIPAFELVLDDLTHTDDDAIEATTRVALSAAGLLALRNAAWADEIEPLIDRLESHLVAAAQVPGGGDALTEIICYLYGVTDVEPGVVENRIIDRLPAEVRESIMTTAERLRAEGHAAGREEGREEGRAEGRAEGREEGHISGMARTLLNQINLKFGAPDRATRALIEVADEAQLDRWTARILTAPTLDALFE